MTPIPRPFTQADSLARSQTIATRKRPDKLVLESTIDTSPAQRDTIIKRVSQMPEVCRLTYLAGRKGDSPSSAIKAFCQMCIGWENMVDNIQNCSDPACPLYPYRPYRE